MTTLVKSFWSLFAEREGFEPPEVLPSTVFKTAAIDHSAISPVSITPVINSRQTWALHLLQWLMGAKVSTCCCFCNFFEKKKTVSCRGSSCLRGCKWPSIVVEDVVEEIVHGLEHGQGGGHPGHPVVDIEVAGWAALQEQVLFHLQEAGHGVSGVKPLGHSLERVAVPLVAGGTLTVRA